MVPLALCSILAVAFIIERFIGLRRTKIIPEGFVGGLKEAFGPSAAAALYRREALEEVGGLDETLFAYYEDVDLAWQLGNRGWRHLYRPEVVARHERRGPDEKPAAIAARARPRV